MNETIFKGMRILVVGGRSANVVVLRSAFGLLGIRYVTTIEDTARAIDTLRSQTFNAIFCDAGVEKFEKMPFHVAARRCAGILNPMTPLFVIYSLARQRQVESARDGGVNDVLTHPVSAATIARKLEAALTAPRKFIAAPSFFGPDRRTERNNAWYGGDRRKRIAKKTRIALPDSSQRDISWV